MIRLGPVVILCGLCVSVCSLDCACNPFVSVAGTILVSIGSVKVMIVGEYVQCVMIVPCAFFDGCKIEWFTIGRMIFRAIAIAVTIVHDAVAMKA